jgi:putative ATP-dependent endonuclease of OLD family
MVGKIQVHLRSPLGAKLPLHRHGEGTQNLAVLMLFQAFVAANLAETYAPESTPLLVMEEPEAHLHPSAIRSLGSFLQNMEGQIFVSSHSGDLVSRVPLTSLRRLYKVNGETKVGYIDSRGFDQDELRAIDYNIRLTKGHYLFSRCWLLVEGQTEFHLMPLLFEIMGFPQDELSFSVIEISQIKNKGEPIIKLAKALGIQWAMMADGDSAGSDYINRVLNYLENGESLTDRAIGLIHADIEHEFWHNGYDDFITNLVTESRRRQIEKEAAGDVRKKIQLLIKAAIKKVKGKPAFARALAAEVNKRGKGAVPQRIKDIISRVVELSGYEI